MARDFDQNGIYLALGFDNTGKSSYVDLMKMVKSKKLQKKINQFLCKCWCIYIWIQKAN